MISRDRTCMKKCESRRIRFYSRFEIQLNVDLHFIFCFLHATHAVAPYQPYLAISRVGPPTSDFPRDIRRAPITEMISDLLSRLKLGWRELEFGLLGHLRSSSRDQGLYRSAMRRDICKRPVRLPVGRAHSATNSAAQPAAERAIAKCHPTCLSHWTIAPLTVQRPIRKVCLGNMANMGRPGHS
jgi:hypothetical protein